MPKIRPSVSRRAMSSSGESIGTTIVDNTSPQDGHRIA